MHDSGNNLMRFLSMMCRRFITISFDLIAWLLTCFLPMFSCLGVLPAIRQVNSLDNLVARLGN